MAISLKEFTKIQGKTSGKGGFKADPNSLTARVFSAVANSGQAVTSVELASQMNEDAKKVDMTLMALAYDKRKNSKGEKVSKLVRGYSDKEKTYFYGLNPQWS